MVLVFSRSSLSFEHLSLTPGNGTPQDVKQILDKIGRMNTRTPASVVPNTIVVEIQTRFKAIKCRTNIE